MPSKMPLSTIVQDSDWVLSAVALTNLGEFPIHLNQTLVQTVIEIRLPDKHERWHCDSMEIKGIDFQYELSTNCNKSILNFEMIFTIIEGSEM